MPTASFFDYDPTIGAYRFIQLTEENPTVEANSSSKTDEGWSQTYVRWELRDGYVINEIETAGRDCDGRTSSQSEYGCEIADLAANQPYYDGDAEASEGGPMPFKTPAWVDGKRSQRDYSAEAAGY